MRYINLRFTYFNLLTYLLKWQNVISSLIKFENLQKQEYSKFVSYDLISLVNAGVN